MPEGQSKAGAANINGAPVSQPVPRPVSHIADPVIAEKPVRKRADPGDIPAVEIGGRDGPEPTRFGDWEKRGRCIDF